jgi:hypothetical protein
MKVEFVKELKVSPSGSRQCLVKMGEKFFVVSSVHAMFTGFETLVFPADESGEITNWSEVAGGRGLSREAAIADLEQRDEAKSA